MVSGKFFFVALCSLLLYTLFINFGYLKFMNASANIYNVYLFDPAGTLDEVSFLPTDLAFAALMTLFNIGLAEAGSILPAILIQTAILSLIMALTGFGCTMLLKDFKQFSLAYLVIALFVATPVFLSANTSIKMAWIGWHPFYHVYMGLKNAFFGIPVTSPVYYICAVCAIILLCGIVGAAFREEMGKEG